MNMRWCRGLAVAVSLASSAMFAGAGIVFACSPAPPQLTLTPDQASPGQVVTASGSGYGAAGSPVVVRLDGQDGPVLWTGQADGAGAIAFSFVTPSMPPAFDFINAYPTGAAAAKGPAHASFQVAGGTPSIEAAPRADTGGGRASIIAPASTPHMFPASPASIAPALLIALVAVSLVGAALLVVAVTHRRRRSNIVASSAEPDGAALRRSPPLSEFVIIARSRTATALPAGGETAVGAPADNAT